MDVAESPPGKIFRRFSDGGRFLNEARIVNHINHPGLVSIYETGQLENGAPYVVMEFLQGETLRDRLRRASGRLEPAQAMRLGRQIGSALAAAHAKGAVHRDIKPANVMLVADVDTSDGERIKLLNFGIAKLTTANTDARLTQPGIMLGTPTYMSPEQCANSNDVTDRSDVYALGIVMYELLAGAPPFGDAAEPVLLITAHLTEDPPPLASRAPEARPELCALVHRMLQKSPSARPSAAEVSSILLGLSGGKVSAAIPVSRAPVAVATPTESPTRMLPPPPKNDDGHTAIVPLLRALPGRPVVLGAVLICVLGVVGIAASILAALPQSAPPPPPITWIVISVPADAEVVDATGLTVGRTPWQQSAAPARGLTTLTLRKKGHGEETIVLDRAQSGERRVLLEALPVEPPSEKMTPRPPPRSLRRGRSER